VTLDQRLGFEVGGDVIDDPVGGFQTFMTWLVSNLRGQ
jgi:hypothetical protein